MAELHNLHVDVDLSEFTSTTGTVTADAAAAMAGTANGLKVVVTAAAAAYGTKALGANKTLVHGRVYFGPNSTSGLGCGFVTLVSGTTFRAEIYFSDVWPAYVLYLAIRNDASGDSWSGSLALSDAAHWLEYEWKASTGAGANNGYIKLWVDKCTGAADLEITGIDNDTLIVNEIRYGASTGISGSGTFYMDQFVANDDGTLIGSLDVKKVLGVTRATIKKIAGVAVGVMGKIAKEKNQ